MSARRLLIVTYHFPPVPTVGANRWDAMARHLRLLGHEVSIITTAAFGRIRNTDDERHVVRAADVTSVAWLRRIFRRGPMLPPSDAPAAEASSARIEKPLPQSLNKILVPDLCLAAWAPQALRVARRAVIDHRIECVVTSSPYESAHLLGFPLRRRGPAWIADFRDGWSFEPIRPPFPTATQRAIDEQMEKRVVNRADRVVTATRPIAEDFRSRLGVDAVYIANGFDPLRYQDLPEPVLPPMRDTVVLAHTGKLAGLNNRNPRGLFAAMRRLRDREPELGARLRLVLAGRLDSADVRLVSESGVAEQIVRLGQCSHAESLALQRRADALVLITSADGSEVTGKLSEYLSAGRPIIALAGPEVARVVSSTGTGVTVRADDVEAITAQLRRLMTGELAASYKAENLEEYVYPGPARRVAEVVEQALAARAGKGASSTHAPPGVGRGVYRHARASRRFLASRFT